MKYQKDEGTRVCAQCGKHFEIPAEDVIEYINVCEECGPKLEASYAEAELKANTATETANAVAAATGN